jgi:RNA polymerase sigma-70 factor (ECF subfamily)
MLRRSIRGYIFRFRPILRQIPLSPLSDAGNVFAFARPGGAGLHQLFRQMLHQVVRLGGAMSDIPVSREFWDRLIQQVRMRTRGGSDPEELLHAAYLRLLRYRAQHAVENIAAFLVRTAVNIGVDNYRHDRFIAGVTPEEVGVTENSPLQDEVLAARVRLDRVREGLSRLTPRTREVFLMHRLDDMKYREIAQCLGISQSAVEKHIAKAALFLTEWTEGW